MTSEINYRDIPILDLSKGEALRLCRNTTTIETIIELSKHSNPQVRQGALKEMCPCRVKDDLTDFWNRVLEMIDDEAVNVRAQVLHTLCDGSPTHLEFDVVRALEVFNRDPDPRSVEPPIKFYQSTERVESGISCSGAKVQETNGGYQV